MGKSKRLSCLVGGLVVTASIFNSHNLPISGGNVEKITQDGKEGYRIIRPPVVVIPRDPKDDKYLEYLIRDKKREAIQPFVDLGFIKKYSVFSENSRVSRFESTEKDQIKYGGLPGINDWVGKDFDKRNSDGNLETKVLFFIQGTRKPVYDKNGIKLDLDKRVDCPICE